MICFNVYQYNVADRCTNTCLTCLEIEVEKLFLKWASGIYLSMSGYEFGRTVTVLERTAL